MRSTRRLIDAAVHRVACCVPIALPRVCVAARAFVSRRRSSRSRASSRFSRRPRRSRSSCSNSRWCHMVAAPPSRASRAAGRRCVAPARPTGRFGSPSTTASWGDGRWCFFLARHLAVRSLTGVGRPPRPPHQGRARAAVRAAESARGPLGRADDRRAARARRRGASEDRAMAACRVSCVV